MNISVVIPLYNKEKYVGRAIESVLKQTIPADDIVVVDDGSVDNSANEVLKFSDCRINLIRQQNSGEGSTRNRGVAEAKCDLVAFLDADDAWKPDFLLHIQRLYNNFPDCGAYATAYEMMMPGNNAILLRFKEIPPTPWIGIIPDFFKLMQSGNPFCSSSVAIPKKTFQELKGFPEKITQGADRMMWVKLGMKYPIAFSPSSQTIYHQNVPNSALSSRFENYSVTANMIDEMLKNREVPFALVDDLQDYSVYLKIHRGYHLVMNGRNKEARELLGSIGLNRKYRKMKLWWWFWSLMPFSLINFMRKLNSKGRIP